MGDISTNPDKQKYKYGGKLLAAKRTIDNRSARRRALAREDCTYGLDLYDFHARQYDPVLGCFNSVDPMAEKYYSYHHIRIVVVTLLIVWIQMVKKLG